MRSIRFSKTFDEQLIAYIDHGTVHFGAAVADRKKLLVYDAVENLIARNPGVKRRDPALGLVVYPVSQTPFFLLYDYDETEVRVHFIFINGKPLSAIDPASAEW
jgi:plasmid stabilization system protein ParE